MQAIFTRLTSFTLRKRTMLIALVLSLFCAAALLMSRAAAQTAATVPTFTIEEVVIDQSVTIQTSNFRAGQDYVVTMGPIGTLGINGTVVGITNSGAGGTFVATYPIPANLVGARQIAIRLESAQGSYSYNWFYNNMTPSEAARPPSFTVEDVVINESVTIQTRNFAPNRTYVVTLGPMGTLGINGTRVGTISSGDGSPQLATFPIPANLVGLERLSIRAESGLSHAYNWFDNQPYSAPVADPTFSICAVVRDESVTIRTDNFPINRPFQVRLGPNGTLGQGGSVVGAFNSGPTGVVLGAFPIPLELQGMDLIAVRIEEVGGPHLRYDWFENYTRLYC